MAADNEGDVNNDGAAVEEEVGGLEEDVVVVAKSGVLAEDVGGDTTRVGVAAKVPSVDSPRVDMGQNWQVGGRALSVRSLQNYPQVSFAGGAAGTAGRR